MSYIQRPTIVGISPPTSPTKNTSAAGLRFAGSVFDFNAAYSMLGWFKLSYYYGVGFAGSLFQVGRNKSGAGYGTCDIVTSAGLRTNLLGGGSNADGWGWNANSPTAALDVASPSAVTYPQINTDPWFWNRWDRSLDQFNWGCTQWFHVALVRTDATHLSVYLNGVLDFTLTHAALTRSAAEYFQIGGRHLGSAYEATAGALTDYSISGKVAYARVFSRALSAGEITTEMWRQAAASTVGLWADYPLTTDRNDTSGNGRHLGFVPNTPDAALGVYAPHVYEWDADVPAGVLPSETRVTVPAMTPIGVAIANGVVVRGDPPMAITGFPHVDPRLAGIGDGTARLTGTPMHAPRLTGLPCNYPRPLGGA